MINIHDVIVIGGGIAGLYASLRCCQYGMDVITFEKDSRWGGRIRTIHHGDDYYEAGAARFHESHQHLLRLLKRYDIKVIPLDKRPRKYRSRLCISSKKEVISPAYKFINEIVTTSKKYSAEFLRSITFGHFAEIVLGIKNKEITQSSFGYDGEFDVINAYDGVKMFENDFDTDETYYICKNGMSSLIDNIVNELTTTKTYSWAGYLEHRVSDIKHKNGIFTVTVTKLDGTKQYVKARQIVIALPKEALEQLHSWNKEQMDIINTVTAVPCERIYAKYDTPWYAGSRITTTDLPIRQFIPITDKIAMISYSDSKQASDWNETAALGEKQLVTRLHNELRELFPERKIPAKPEWIETYYWKDAIHMWKQNVNSTEMRKRIQSELWEKSTPFYVCGEAYSAHQCWVNGALESVDQIMSLVRKNNKKKLATRAGGASAGSWLDWVKSKNSKISKEDLKELKKLYPEARWVLFKDRLINLTEWYYSHPGGQTPFDNHMYTNVYPFFSKIGSHYDTSMGKKDIKHEVMKKIEQLTIGYVS